MSLPSFVRSVDGEPDDSEPARNKSKSEARTVAFSNISWSTTFQEWADFSRSADEDFRSERLVLTQFDDAGTLAAFTEYSDTDAANRVAKQLHGRELKGRGIRAYVAQV